MRNFYSSYQYWWNTHQSVLDTNCFVWIVLQLLISYLSKWLRSNSTFFPPSIPGQLLQKESRICDKKVLWILSRTAGWHLSVLNYFLPLPSRQKKRALPQQILWLGVPQIKTWCSGASQQKAVTQESSAGKCSVFHQQDVYCLPTEQQLPSAAVTSFSKTPKEQSQWQHYQNAWRGRGGGRNGLCRMSSAPRCQQGHWIPCLASPGCSSPSPTGCDSNLSLLIYSPPSEICLWIMQALHSPGFFCQKVACGPWLAF